MHILFRFILITLLWCSLIIEPAASAAPFIIDTDMGVDDVIAIMYLLKNPAVDVKAITIAADGNAHCMPALQNALGLLKLSKNKLIPVACGQSKPLKGNHRFPKQILLESDTLAGTSSLLPFVNPERNQHAVNLIHQTLLKSSEPISILSIGPLTNIAQAIRTFPEIKRRIKRIYIMGGAFEVPGNINIVDPTINNKSAEWNIFIDPYAADFIIKQNIPITFIPLDVTNQLPIDIKFFRTLEKNHKSIEANYIYSIFLSNIKMINNKSWYFWDPLAAIIAVNPKIATYEKKKITILQNPETISGRTLLDPKNGDYVEIVTHVNSTEFINRLQATLDASR